MEPFTLTDKKTGQKFTVYANSKQEAAQIYKSGNRDKVLPIENKEQEQLDADKLIQSYNKQQSYMQPYREGLQDLISNYDDLQRQAFNRDRYLAGIAGWSNNNNFGNLIGKYNPAEIEATRLDLVNKLAQNKIADEQGANTIVGTAKMMQKAGMPPEMALVDPAMIGKLSNILSAQTSAEARKYSADLNYKARMLDSYLDAAIKEALNKNNTKLAIQLQYMKNQNALQRTYMQQIPWTTDYAMLNAVMNDWGIPVNQVVQPQIMQPQYNQASQPQTGQAQPINYKLNRDKEAEGLY